MIFPLYSRLAIDDAIWSALTKAAPYRCELATPFRRSWQISVGNFNFINYRYAFSTPAAPHAPSIPASKMTDPRLPQQVGGRSHGQAGVCILEAPLRTMRQKLLQ
jgi:hypothetical protein